MFLGTHSFNFDPGGAKGTRYFPPPRFNTPFLSILLLSSFFFSTFFSLSSFSLSLGTWNTLSRLNCVGRRVGSHKKYNIFLSFDPSLSLRICKFNSTWELWESRLIALSLSLSVFEILIRITANFYPWILLFSFFDFFLHLSRSFLFFSLLPLLSLIELSL